MPKSTLLMLIGLSLLIALAFSVSAAVQLSKSEVLLSVNYEGFTSDDQQVLRVLPTDSFVLINDGAEPVTVRVVATSLPQGYLSETRTVTIPANANSESLSLNIDVPHKEDSGKSTIGTLSVTQASDNTPLASAPLKQETQPMLELNRVEISYVSEDNDDEFARFSETDREYTIDQNVLIGSTMKVNFKVKNLFNRNYDEDSRFIDDIELTIEASDDDLFGGERFTTRYPVGDLEAKNSQEIEVQIPIGVKADTGDYTLEVTLEGTDGEGATHTLERTIEFEIVRKRDDIRITKAQLSPATLSCGDTITVDLELTNFGSRSQEFAGVLVYNEMQSVNKNVQDIQLEEYADAQNVWREQLTFPLRNQTRGTYTFDVTALIDRSVEADSKRVTLTVDACAPQQPAQQQAQQQEQPQQQGGQQEVPAEDDDAEPAASGDVVKSVEKVWLPRFEFPLPPLWALGVGFMILVVVAMDVMLLTLLLRKKER